MAGDEWQTAAGKLNHWLDRPELELNA